MTWLKANIQMNKVNFKNKEGTTYDNYTPQMMWMVMIWYMMEVMVEVAEEDISQFIFLLFTSYVSLSLIFLLHFSSFLKKIQNNLHEIRIWKSFWVFEESM